MFFQQKFFDRQSFGVHLGDHYWIIFKAKWYSQFTMYDEEITFKIDTILWSIKKEKWIPGPNLLKSGEDFNFGGVEICLVGIGNEEAHILMDNRHTC